MTMLLRSRTILCCWCAAAPVGAADAVSGAGDAAFVIAGVGAVTATGASEGGWNLPRQPP